MHDNRTMSRLEMLKCGDLQGINAGLMSLGRVISLRLKQELFGHLHFFKLQVMSAFVVLCKLNPKQNFK